VKAHFSSGSPGVPDGQWIFYYNNGKEALNCDFSDGEISTEGRFFSEKGTPLTIKGKAGLIDFIEKFNKTIFGENRFSVFHQKCIKFKNQLIFPCRH